MRVPLAITSVLAVLVALATFAQASPAAEPSKKAAAKELFEKGAIEYNLGRCSQAIPLFEKAYGLDPDPMLLFNIGQCHRLTGNRERAIFFYRRYLGEERDPPNRGYVDKQIADLERAMKEEKEQAAKPPPAAERVEGGTGRPSGPPAPPATGPAPAAIPVAPTPRQEVGPSDRMAPAPDPSARSLKRKLAWVTAGGATLSLGLGIGFQIAASSAFEPLNQSCALLPGTETPVADPASSTPRTDAECVALYDAWQVKQRVFIAGYVGAGVLAAASAVLFLTSRSDPPQESAHARVSCLPTITGLSCQGVF
jgi:tetratricopeptide (TPR) repeat protein